MIHGIKKFWMDEQGATAIEYALLAGIISTAILATFQQIGPLLVAKYESVNDGFNN